MQDCIILTGRGNGKSTISLHKMKRGKRSLMKIYDDYAEEIKQPEHTLARQIEKELIREYTERVRNENMEKYR